MRRLRMLAALAGLMLLSGSAVLTASAAVPADGAVTPTGGAAGLWAASLEGVHGVAPDATVRQIARVSAPGFGLRVRLGNPFGSAPVVIRSVYLGKTIAPGSPRLVAGSNRPVSFHGSHTVTISPGQSVVSDPVPLAVEADEDVAVSVYAPGSPVNDHTFPPFAYDPPASFIGTGGDHAADPADTTFPGYPVIPGNSSSTAVGYHPGQTWWLDLVTADHAAARGTLVTLGDSITDGYNAYGPPGQRWTDVLAHRLNALPASARLSVANAGISGNTVSVQPNPYDPTGQCCGPPAPERLDRDVLSVPGLRTVLLLEGTNDLGGGGNAPPASAQQVISAMRDIASRLHSRGVRVVAGTVLPMCNAAGSDKELARLAVNEWIRTSGTFDAVVDFDALLRDPADPTVMRADLKNDCYHPNAAGDAVLGRSIPLSAVTG